MLIIIRERFILVDMIKHFAFRSRRNSIFGDIEILVGAELFSCSGPIRLVSHLSQKRHILTQIVLEIPLKTMSTLA